MTNNAQIDRYLAYQKATDKSPATLASYRSDLMQFAQWFQKNNPDELRLNKITPTDTRQYKKHLMTMGFKPQTINRRLLSLKYFIEWGWETQRIAYRFPLPKLVGQVAQSPQWLDKREQNQSLRHAERYGTNKETAIVKILLNTGLRVSELCQLTWSDVTLNERKGKLTVTAGKRNKYREVPLNKEARQAFLDLGYQEHAGQSERITIGQRGPLGSRGIQLMLGRLLKNSELGIISPHQLRHTFCKNLVDAGISLEKVAALAGHEQLETTRRYCQPSLGDLRQAVEQIGGFRCKE